MVRTASTMLPLGTEAPDFSLPDFNGKIVTRDDFRGQQGLLVMFMCNHCPYVKHVAPELARLADDYQPKGVGVVGISSNDVVAHPEDSPEMMKQEAADRGYSFPYLYDESQSVAQAYHAACTPDFYLFDGDLRLIYRGQLDDSRPKQGSQPTGHDLRAALDALLAGKPVPEPQKPSIGCNIKWKSGAEPGYFDASGTA
ncbi:thioredoxin family protein [Aureliella helgolandensis]|uniref:Peroxiredoxin n=1 Tax=Aureliella helgolandensis TaxID=2527968 RepID=A0A518G6T8_9BACT|nr:thioredoxin family protein [Aureliella helgolandensis]QDV24299.1 Putative peroxiredoxin [Aureliella helgolandensis]